ncbi:hypothetical protein VTO42DRAFT_7043 [Malbranchea cinnamomea]
MKLINTQLLFTSLAISAVVDRPGYAHKRCAYGDPCWPSDHVWQSFNSSISGRLIRTFPSAAVCHDETYDVDLCMVAKEEWGNSFWRTNQTGAYTAIAWELGDGQCFIDSPREAPCDQGLGNNPCFVRSDGAELRVSYSTTVLCRSTRCEGYSRRDKVRKQARFVSRREEYRS